MGVRLAGLSCLSTTKKGSELVFERLKGVRVVTPEKSLNALLADPRFPRGQVALRLAFDELFTVGELERELVYNHDPHAVVCEETSFFGSWLAPEQGRRLLSRHCEWRPPGPEDFPILAQGAVSGVPVKIWFTAERWLFVVQSPYLHEFEERVA